MNKSKYKFISSGQFNTTYISVKENNIQIFHLEYFHTYSPWWVYFIGGHALDFVFRNNIIYRLIYIKMFLEKRLPVFVSEK